jgi:uncharacterized membrane protein YhaH (DUF805 family)
MGNIDFKDLLLTFNGRVNRAKYWIAVVVYLVVMLVAVAVLFVLPGMIGFVVMAVLYIAMAISGVFVGIKRLHDCDKSGWWLLLFYVVPSLLSGAGTGMGGAMILNLISFAISIWAIVQLGFLRGTAGPNRFGPDPIPAAA